LRLPARAALGGRARRVEMPTFELTLPSVHTRVA